MLIRVFYALAAKTAGHKDTYPGSRGGNDKSRWAVLDYLLADELF
jgi:hypothetical protein